MNADRRKQLKRQLEEVSVVGEQLQILLEEEQEAFDNMPESLQGGDKGEKVQEAITALESAIQSLEEVESYIEEAQA